MGVLFRSVVIGWIQIQIHNTIRILFQIKSQTDSVIVAAAHLGVGPYAELVTHSHFPRGHTIIFLMIQQLFVSLHPIH